MKSTCDNCQFKSTIENLGNQVDKLKETIQEAKDRLRYYFGTFDGKFDSPQLQNIYDVLGRDDH